MQNPSPPPIGSPELDAIALDSSTYNSPSPFNWNDLLDFDIPLPLPADHSPQQQQPDFTQQQSDKVRKRDPRLTCSNFLAGRVPCACPELDALIADKEEEEVGPGKKRARAGRDAVSGLLVCQVPGCEADISELKGYHRRHRVCLGCANAGSVVVDGEGRRYCQQCGKFHVLSDFDEGKRSCRRRLERHNNRRRRKLTDPKGLIEIDSQQVVLPEDGVFGDKIGEDTVGLSSQIAEAERLLDTDEHISIPCPAPDSKNIQSVSGVSGGAYGDTKRDDQKDQSPSYYDNKSAFSSVCPTARISFKLYDWNPAEFPRQLRHQILQWLASMPVELEGYIRPGCTILTLFIAMPSLMWDKLFEDPLAYLHDLIVGPGSILSGKGSFHVYLNNMVFRVVEDKTSVVKTLVGKQAPKIHHVHPACFEAGKPMEFVVCGSDLLQPKFRFLVSFVGEYLIDDVSGSSVFKMTEDNIASGSDHELLRISVPRTETNLFGPAFVEVENESGLSNFIPILIGPKEICSELNILQQKLNASHSKRPHIAVTGASCGVSSSSQKYISEFILDVAWMLKEPVLENKQRIPISSQVQRFSYLFNFLIENESFALLDRVAYYARIVMNNRVTIGVADPDIKLYQSNVDRVNSILKQKFQNEINSALHVRNLFFPVVPVVKPDMAAEKRKFVASVASTSVDGSETVPLSNTEVIMNVKLVHEPRKASRHLFTNRALTSRPLLFVISAAAVCFGICAVVFHPEKVGEIAVTIHRCLFNQS